MSPVMDDPDEVAAVFRGTELDGLPLEEGLGDTGGVSVIEERQLLPAWRAARAATAETGRWPVLTAVDECWLDAESDQVEALEHAARTVDPWAVYHWWGTDSLIEPEDLHLGLPDLLGQDAAEQAWRDLSSPGTLAAVERWTWERLLADPTALEQAWPGATPYVGTRQWFTLPPGRRSRCCPRRPSGLPRRGSTTSARRRRRLASSLVTTPAGRGSLRRFANGSPPWASRRGSSPSSTWPSAAVSKHHNGVKRA